MCASTTDLVVLNSNYNISINDINIPYIHIFNELKLRKKLDLIKNFHSDELFAFRETDEWLEIFNAALLKKTKKIKNFQTLYANRSINKSIEEGKGNIQIFTKEITMGDSYSANQVGAQGTNAHAHNISFNQIWNQNAEKFDIKTLENELSKLRGELKNKADTPEQLSELGMVANAEIEAKKGNGAKILKYLSKTGKWTLEVAEKIGVNIVIAAIKASFCL
jgi:hypothetical protein